MISDMAIEDFDKMISAGLKPTPRDIIRLNALALKVERSPSSAELYTLPRVAYLGKLTFREPTIGHGMWIDAVSNYCDANDFPTALAIDAFAMSRNHDMLPDAADRKAVRAAIDAFTKADLAPFTIPQVHVAVEYAKHGANIAAKEYPADPPGEEDEEDNPLASVGVGVLFETLAMSLGLSVRDVLGFTVSKAKALQEAGMAARGLDLIKDRHGKRVAEYMATKHEIIERLKTEARNG